MKPILAASCLLLALLFALMIPASEVGLGPGPEGDRRLIQEAPSGSLIQEAEKMVSAGELGPPYNGLYAPVAFFESIPMAKDYLTADETSRFSDRAGLMNPYSPVVGGPVSWESLQEINLAMVGYLASVAEHPGLSKEEQTRRILEQVSRSHATMLDLEWNDDVYIPQHETPSQAVFALAQRHNGLIGPEQAEALIHLDRMEPQVRDAFTNVINAFLALDLATERAYEHADMERLSERSRELTRGDPAGIGESTPGMLLDEAGIDFTDVFPARWMLTEASFELKAALEETGEGVPSFMVPASQHGSLCDLNPLVCANNNVRPFVETVDEIIDNSGDVDELIETFNNVVGRVLCVNAPDDEESNRYTQDCLLLIHLDDGQVEFYNNAGGSGVVLDEGGDPCNVLPVTAALIDLSDSGDKRFGDPNDPRDCGANGGAFLGVGFLLSLSDGDHHFVGGGKGVNGGVGFGNTLEGGGGVGLLVASGDGDHRFEGGGEGDTFTGGVNGGARSGGAGALIRTGTGDDHYVYVGGGNAVNGGGNLGIGFLLDLQGDDRYIASGGQGLNGGGALGVGTLLDLGGTDRYEDKEIPEPGEAGYLCVNDSTGDCGFVAGGEDADEPNACKDCSVLGKGSLGGPGVQLDLPLMPLGVNPPSVEPPVGAGLRFEVQPPAEVKAGEVWSDFSVKAEDKEGDGVEGVEVTIRAVGGGDELLGTRVVTTNNDGLAIFGDIRYETAQEMRVEASADGSDPITSDEVLVEAGPAFRVTKVIGDDQTGRVKEPLEQDLVVRVEDEFENPVAGQEVVFDVATNPEGGADYTLDAEAGTDEDGAASNSLTLGSKVGDYVVEVTVEGPEGPLEGAPVVFTATAEPGDPEGLWFQVAPAASVEAGATWPEFAVAVVDGFGNVIKDDSSTQITVAAAETQNGNELEGVLTATVEEGVAVFDDVRYPAMETIRVEASGEGLESVMSDEVHVAGGAAFRVVMVRGDGQSGPVMERLDEGLVVRIEDKFENPVEGQEVVFMVTSSPNGPMDHLLEVDSPTSSSGEASAELVLGSTAGDYVVEVTVEGPEGPLEGAPVVFTATAEPGDPEGLWFQVAPAASVEAGATWPEFAVAVVDGFGNVIKDDSSTQITVAAAETQNGNELEGVLTATVEEGIAVFDDVRYKMAETIRVRAGAGEFDPRLSGNVVVTPGPLGEIKILDGEGDPVDEVTIDPGVELGLVAKGYDSFGNPRGPEAVSWTATGTLDPIEAGPFSEAVLKPWTLGSQGTISASKDGIMTQTGTITVSTQGLAFLQIHDAPMGEGAELSDLDLVAGEEAEVHIVAYNDEDELLGTAVVQWSVGPQGMGSLDPEVGRSSVFKAEQAQSGTIAAEFVDDDGQSFKAFVSIVVEVGPVNSLMIRDAADGEGASMDAWTVAAGQSKELFAAGYDSHGNFVEDVVVAWSVMPSEAGTLDPDEGKSTTLLAQEVGDGSITISHMDSAIGIATIDLRVIPGNVERIEIQGAAGQGGDTIDQLGLVAGGEQTLHGAPYDSEGNVVEGVTVLWSVDPEELGSFSLEEGLETVFTAAKVGTGTITAESVDEDDQAFTASLSVGVQPGPLTSMKVRDAAGGGGGSVDALTVTVGNAVELFAAGYDSHGNFVDDVEVSWTLTPPDTGTLDPEAGTNTTFLAQKATAGSITIIHPDPEIPAIALDLTIEFPPRVPELISGFTVDCDGMACTFDGSPTQQGGSEIVGFGWDFGDGNAGIGQNVTHRYSGPGEYTVVLDVTDEGGNQSKASEEVHIEGPVIELRVDVTPNTPREGNTVWINAAVINNGTGPLTDYQIHFHMDDLPLHQAAFTELPADSWNAVGTTWTAVVGNHTLYVEVPEFASKQFLVEIPDRSLEERDQRLVEEATAGGGPFTVWFLAVLVAGFRRWLH